jgi:hypothetical protein
MRPFSVLHSGLASYMLTLTRDLLVVLGVLIGKSDDMQSHEFFQIFESWLKILPLAVVSPNW